MQKCGLSVRQLWEYEGTSWVDVAKRHHWADTTIAHHARRLGFVRNPRTSTYKQGPCIICQEAHERDEIDDTLRCPKCLDAVEVERVSRPSEPYHLARWGTRPDRGHSDWIELERTASEYRMRCNDRRERLRPVRCYLPGGALPGGPMPGPLR